MRMSLQMTIGIAIFLAVASYAVAINGFIEIRDMTDAEKIADAWGFAWFWAFLGTLATVFGVLGWWILRTQREGEG